MRYAYLNEDEDRTSLLTASVRALFLPPSNYPAEVHVPAKSILYLLASVSAEDIEPAKHHKWEVLEKAPGPAQLQQK